MSKEKRIEDIENNLSSNQILVFFDFTKYNYLAHDLCFVLLRNKTSSELIEEIQQKNKQLQFLKENGGKKKEIEKLEKKVLSPRKRSYFHYMHAKSKDGKKISNDGKYAVQAFKLFLKELERLKLDKHEIFLASDGGGHFVNAIFVDFLTSLNIVEWNRFAPHHGGNYCD